MNRKRISILTVLALSTSLSLFIVSEVQATSVTLTISTPVLPVGSLTISAPTSFDLGTTIANSVLTKQMGPITVIDGRGAGVGWVASVIASALTNSTVGNTIIPTAMTYESGAFLVTGTATLTENDQSNLTGVVNVVTATAITGHMSATWNPSFILTIPAGAADGSYTGTITHSVA